MITTAQIKFVVNDDLAKEFKQTVLAKRGKMEASREGEEALKLYLEKNKRFSPARITGKKRRNRQARPDPILGVIGAVKSKEKRSALEDVKLLDSSEI